VATSTAATATPTPAPGSPEGTYISTQPAADASALLWELFLGPNGNASWLSNYVGKGTINATGVWEMISETAVRVTLIHREDKNINEVFEFNIEGDKLVATQYDQSMYGDSGITLYKANANVTGTINYAESITLPDDAVIEAYLIDATDPNMTATYISGISNRANGQQKPIAFSLPYDSLQINPAGNYRVQAFISSNGRLLFSNSVGVAVITNGAPTANVEVVVVPPAQ
jgi:putative lipoprotein